VGLKHSSKGSSGRDLQNGWKLPLHTLSIVDHQFIKQKKILLPRSRNSLPVKKDNSISSLQKIPTTQPRTCSSQ